MGIALKHSLRIAHPTFGRNHQLATLFKTLSNISSMRLRTPNSKLRTPNSSITQDRFLTDGLALHQSYQTVSDNVLLAHAASCVPWQSVEAILQAVLEV